VPGLGIDERDTVFAVQVTLGIGIKSGLTFAFSEGSKEDIIGGVLFVMRPTSLYITEKQ
jgi:hypothetical protein